MLRVQVTQQKDLIFQMSIPQKRSFPVTQLQEQRHLPEALHVEFDAILPRFLKLTIILDVFLSIINY